MVTRSLFTGVSGLQGHFDKLDTLSNNISNVNTPGYKKSDVVFKSFFSQQTQIASSPDGNGGGTNPQSIGLGTSIGSISLDMSQGQLQRTGVNTDLAIEGEGFFQTKQASSGRALYTRAGSFEVDGEGNLVDPANGNQVQGYTAEVEDGRIQDLKSTGVPDDIKITRAMEAIPGQETTFQDLAGNLDADASVGVESTSISYENEGSSGEMEFDFERYHPTKRMYRFSATWKSNPPSGKKIGDSVVDQITGRELQGIMKLDDEGKVTQLYRNPDTNGNNGIEQVEANRDNSQNYEITAEAIEARDQTNFLKDLSNQDWNGELRVKFGTAEGTDVTGPTEGPDSFSDSQYALQWQDVRGDWRNVLQNSQNGNEAVWKGDISDGRNDFVKRDSNSDGNVDRMGELEFKDNFIQENSAAEGDVISFSVAEADENGMLNQTGEEVKEEFRWGGTGTERFRVSDPKASSTNSGNGSLNRVFNYNEENIGLLNNSNHINDIPNKEFNIFFSDSDTFHVAADTNGNKGTTDSLSSDYTPSTDGDTIDLSDADPATTTTSNYSEGDLIKIKGQTTTTPSEAVKEVAIVEDVDNTSEQLQITSPVGSSDELDHSYDSASTTVANLGKALTSNAGSVSMGADSDHQLFTGQTAQVSTSTASGDGSGSDAEPGNAIPPGEAVVIDNSNNQIRNFSEGDKIRIGDEFRRIKEIGDAQDTPAEEAEIFLENPLSSAPAGGTTIGKEVGVSIAAEDWEGSVNQDDEFEFTLTEARSQSSLTGRPFMIAKDGGNQNTAIFGPEGSPDQPSEINFAPNTDDQSGILDMNQPGFSNLQAEDGTAGATEQKQDEDVQQVASADVFDSLGSQHTISYRFEKQSENNWMWHVNDPTAVDPENSEIAGFGKISFNENGQLKNSENFVSKVAEDLPPPGQEGDLDQKTSLGVERDPKEREIYFNPPAENLQSDPEEPDPQNPDIGASPVSIDPDFKNVTQFAGETSSEIADQDGVSKGRLSGLNFDTDGILNGSYDNGESRQLAQVAISKFRNPEGLKKEGGTYFSETTNSGLARDGTPGEGARGSISPGSLERSNVDLSAQFTELISTQRGFQANTRTISTTDQMLQQVLALR